MLSNIPLTGAQDPYETQSILGNLLKSATKEIMLMIPTLKSFDKQHDIGILKLYEYEEK